MIISRFFRMDDYHSPVTGFSLTDFPVTVFQAPVSPLVGFSFPHSSCKRPFQRHHGYSSSGGKLNASTVLLVTGWAKQRWYDHSAAV